MSQVIFNKLTHNSNSNDFSFDSEGWTQRTLSSSNRFVDTNQENPRETDLESIFSTWEEKLTQLETQINDVKEIRSNVGKTLEKARLKPIDKENIPPQNMEKEVQLEQSFNYQYKSEQDQSVIIKLNETARLDIVVESCNWWDGDIPLQKRPIGQFLNDANAQAYMNNFLDIAIYDNERLLTILREEGCWEDLLLHRLGIDRSGYRKAIYLQLMEDCDQFRKKGLLKYSKSLGDEELPTLSEWLQSCGLQECAKNLEESGYGNFVNLIVIQSSEIGFIDANHLSQELGLHNLTLASKLFNELERMTKKMTDFNFGTYLKRVASQQPNVVTCSLVQQKCAMF